MMPGQALFSAPAAAVTAAATLRPPSIGGDAPQFGMTMWFKVVVDGRLNLGSWSTCSGLGVKFTVEQVKESINHDAPRFVPVGLDYGQITLERAMTAKDSKKVHDWLAAVTAGWVNGPEGGAPGGAAGSAKGFEGAPVTITLYSAVRPSRMGASHEVAKWELRDAYPVAWAGPTLSSKTSDVAIEKLTLAHSGFLKPGVGPKAPKPASASQGMLRITDETGNSLPLQYNPEKVTMNKQVTIKDNSAGPTYIKDEQVTDPGKMSISFEVRVEGVTAVGKATKQFWDWLEPQDGGWVSARPTGKAPQAGPAMPNRGLAPLKGQRKAPQKGANTKRPKVLTIHIGAGGNAIQRTAILKQVNTTFTRFTRTGEPSRATINLTLEEKAVRQKKTNPTSGSPPGDRVHTLLEGESLATVATEAYGTPSAWREVAEHNGIDDPMRLRNGRPLYLPGV